MNAEPKNQSCHSQQCTVEAQVSTHQWPSVPPFAAFAVRLGVNVAASRGHVWKVGQKKAPHFITL